MKRIILALACICLTAGCGVFRHQPTVVYRDSTHVEYRDHIVRDTVEFELPVIIEKYITTDTLSVIENEYARSAAVVHDGFLSHDLQLKPKVFRIPVAVEVRDTLIREKMGETVIKVQEVEKKLTKWQSMQMWLGKADVILFCAALGALLIYILYRLFARKLLGIQ